MHLHACLEVHRDNSLLPLPALLQELAEVTNLGTRWHEFFFSFFFFLLVYYYSLFFFFKYLNNVFLLSLPSFSFS